MSNTHFINICFVTREYSHPKTGIYGGIGVFTKQLAAQLAKNDLKVNIFTFGEKKLNFDDSHVSVLQIKDLTKVNNLIKSKYLKLGLPGYISLKIFLAFVNRLFRSIYFSLYSKKNKFDIVEFHDYGGDLPFFYGKSIKVIRCHGSARTLHRYMNYVFRKVDDTFEGVAFKNYNKNIIAVSKYSALTTQEAFNLDVEPKVIYNGITPSKDFTFKTYFENKNLVPKSIFYLGSIRERKGIDDACNVFNKIINIFPNASFHVLGNNNNDYWNKTAVLKLTEKAKKNTIYHGAVHHSQIFEYISRAHILIYPSYGENFSLALLEGMSIGKIVITSSIDSFKEVVQHGSNGFNANSEKDYIDIISSIFRNEVNINEISLNAFNTIKNNFNSNELTKTNIIYYKSLLSNAK